MEHFRLDCKRCSKHKRFEAKVYGEVEVNCTVDEYGTVVKYGSIGPPLEKSLSRPSLRDDHRWRCAICGSDIEATFIRSAKADNTVKRWKKKLESGEVLDIWYVCHISDAWKRATLRRYSTNNNRAFITFYDNSVASADEEEVDDYLHMTYVKENGRK